MVHGYTTIEQSRKLAEILPLESADMYYEPSAGFCTEPSEVRFGDIKYAHPRSTRCWSLAALLSVLSLPDLIQDKVDGELFWQCSVYNEDGTVICEVYDNNPVDACVTMIEKLHELKML